MSLYDWLWTVTGAFMAVGIVILGTIALVDLIKDAFDD